MTRVLLFALLAGTALPAAAQVPPPRDTIVVADPLLSDTLVPGDSTPRRSTRWTTPFAVESHGRPVARRVRGEVVWFQPDTTARDSAALARDSAATDSAPTRTVRVDSAGRDSTPRPRRTAARRDSAAADSAARRRTSTARTDTTTRTARDTAARTPARRPRTHTVAAGETLFGIARRYNVTTAQLRALNPDLGETLEVGTVLRLPAAARAPVTAPARPAAAAPRPARRTHTVARGETLYAVARRYGVSVDALMRANRLQEDQVRVGQTLIIP